MRNSTYLKSNGTVSMYFTSMDMKKNIYYGTTYLLYDNFRSSKKLSIIYKKYIKRLYEKQK